MLTKFLEPKLLLISVQLLEVFLFDDQITNSSPPQEEAVGAKRKVMGKEEEGGGRVEDWKSHVTSAPTPTTISTASAN
ncbi:unnamed protein product [Acanthocheilonema viteae]|uniref:Uncharacterized protein n=1 Tax=Acanthocheilonema viteae TaxID=6277 RepID=A0A498S6L7_ACAVI|nr:unnamed protein product [Acanthocheilonema viteae]